MKVVVYAPIIPNFQGITVAAISQHRLYHAEGDGSLYSDQSINLSCTINCFLLLMKTGDLQFW